MVNNSHGKNGYGFVRPKMTSLSRLLLPLYLMLLSIGPAKAEHDFGADIIITGKWGVNEGEFGYEKKGKTEDGYSLDVVVTKNEIYILDAMNNRIQIFDKSGNLKSVIKLKIKWEDFGVPFGFALHKKHFYILTGKPPYYGRIGIRELQKFTYDGVFVKAFGQEYIPKETEDFYEKIFANEKYIYCEINGSILAFDADGSLKSTVFTSRSGENLELLGIGPNDNLLAVASGPDGENRRTLLINPNNKTIIKETPDRFSMLDRKGTFLNIRTLGGSQKKKTITTTYVDFFDTVTGRKGRLELKGDIKIIKNSMIKLYRYAGPFFETSSIDHEGNIYHLIALEDGVVVRRVSFDK